MLIVLWSTPRTGSTWYSHFLYDELKKTHPFCLSLRQYLNKFQFDTYRKLNKQDLVKPFEPGCFYTEYYLDNFAKKISSRLVSDKRTLNLYEEESYRIGLLEKHNLIKFPIILSQHVMPMSVDAYKYLKNKATRNIYIYRENIINQLASYIVASYLEKFVRGEHEREIVVKDAFIDSKRLYDFYERIKYWHNLDKTNCEVIKYEDIDFSQGTFVQKQNSTVKAIDQISDQMKEEVYKINFEFQNFLNLKNPTKDRLIIEKNLLP